MQWSSVKTQTLSEAEQILVSDSMLLGMAILLAHLSASNIFSCKEKKIDIAEFQSSNLSSFQI